MITQHRVQKRSRQIVYPTSFYSCVLPVSIRDFGLRSCLSISAFTKLKSPTLRLQPKTPRSITIHDYRRGLDSTANIMAILTPYIGLLILDPFAIDLSAVCLFWKHKVSVLVITRTNFSLRRYLIEVSLTLRIYPSWSVHICLFESSELFNSEYWA